MIIVLFGAGNMGEIISKSIPKDFKLIIVDRDFARALRVSREIDATVCADVEIVKKADIIILALPPNELICVVQEIFPLIKENTLLVNIATTINKEQIKHIIGDHAAVVGVKIIGQANEINRGGEVVIVIDADNEDVKDRVMEIFSGLGGIIFGDEMQFQVVNSIAAEEVIKAAAKIKERLVKKNIPEIVINTAVRTVAAGTLRDFPWENPDCFIEKLMRELR